MIETTLLGVFLIGLFGGVHCVGMCGGIVAALGMVNAAARSPRTASGDAPVLAVSTSEVAVPIAALGRPSSTGVSPVLAQLPMAIGYNVGRIGTYTLLGFAVGAVGSFPFLLERTLPLQQIAFTLTNIMLVVMGLYVGGWRRIGLWIERLGQRLWQPIAPHASRWLRRPGVAASLAAGGLWGMVPCGLVYGMLVTALGSGSALRGATLMFVFGLGTLPNLLALGLSAGALSRFLRRPRVRLGAGIIIILFGVIGFLRSEVALSVPILRELCVHLP